MSRREDCTKYLFILPALVFTVCFTLYPLIYNLLLSFKDATAMSLMEGNSKFIGLKNYIDIIKDPVFTRVVLNTIIFTVGSILFQFIIGFLIALLFDNDFPGKNFMIALVMLPWFVPVLVSATVFKLFFADTGLLNNVLLSLRLIRHPIPWITDASKAIYSVTIANIWLGIPFNFIMIYTGLRGIPREIYEVAELDGAISYKKVFYIILPILKPVIITTILLGTIFTVKVFDLIWIITGGGPGNSSHLFSTLAYKLAFTDYNFGIGTATTVIMILIIVIAVSILNQIKVEE
ncbi:binding-protein-dependent transport systems inner membrane component [Caldicellulosiruptor hydrothermalis 108]|uniref:Binding-protein-dependent transport systems inner membrane component n=1 Tax=Caldicellulosiruptor hydrothermalis (strain DSM 18901 / VKM B-2411 / 108) TaxID=632292 RepID=E4QDM0_CALH1|nr:ABC transporter permease subunit [Caldicellulosiruptor hydrothermalis]ADQ06437.1 binding-protein-dependent transport systems inner membrane component [Caldicellulosiruptor hydrothermalis 108]